MALIEFSDKGLYCPIGGFFIDPWKPVNKAVISHGHSDHARMGNGYYLCHTFTKPILRARLGDNKYQTLDWNQSLTINGVKISFHPAGHIIGSAQVRLEYKGEVWVFSGDYKLEDDGISGLFEPVKCNVFITESTFGLPVFNWQKQDLIFDEMKNWIQQNIQEEKSSVIIAYSLGKAQRVLNAVKNISDNIYAHGAIANMNDVLINAGHNLPTVKRITTYTKKSELKNAVIIAPPSSEGTSWMKRFTPYSLGICSGWMQIRGNARRKNADRGFILSDHADWNGLVTAVKASEAEKVYVTHGFQSVFSKYLNEINIEAHEVKTNYGTEEELDLNLDDL